MYIVQLNADKTNLLFKLNTFSKFLIILQVWQKLPVLWEMVRGEMEQDIERTNTIENPWNSEVLIHT